MLQRSGFRQSSGFRTPEHNRRVGGVEGSDHTRGHAVQGDPWGVAEAIDGVPEGGWGGPGTPRRAQQMARVREEAAAEGLEVLFHDAGSGLHAHLYRRRR